MRLEMKLNPAPFESIKIGRKTTELRLFDEKRRKIKIGDEIVFKNTETEETLAVRVKSLRRYASFEALFEKMPPEECGFAKGISPKAASEGMREYYSEEEEKKFGVLGIGIERIDEIK